MVILSCKMRGEGGGHELPAVQMKGVMRRLRALLRSTGFPVGCGDWMEPQGGDLFHVWKRDDGITDDRGGVSVVAAELLLPSCYCRMS